MAFVITLKSQQGKLALVGNASGECFYDPKRASEVANQYQQANPDLEVGVLNVQVCDPDFVL